MGQHWEAAASDTETSETEVQNQVLETTSGLENPERPAVAIAMETKVLASAQELIIAEVCWR